MRAAFFVGDTGVVQEVPDLVTIRGPPPKQQYRGISSPHPIASPSTGAREKRWTAEAFPDLRRL